MAQKAIEALFKELGKKYNLPPYVIEEVYNSQFKKVKEEINSLEFPIIKLPSWGKYVPSKKKLERFDYTEKRKLLELKKLKLKDNAGTNNTGDQPKEV